MKIIGIVFVVLLAMYRRSYGAGECYIRISKYLIEPYLINCSLYEGLQRMCAYYEPVETNSEYYRSYEEEVDDYQEEVIPTITANNFTSDVSEW